MRNITEGLKITRHWYMPDSNTLAIPCFNEIFRRYNRGISIDPFARNSTLTTHTNDLNPDTTAQHHLIAEAFLEWIKIQGIKPDMVVFDPPYSLRQVKECYDSFGTGFTHKDSQNAIRWTIERNLIADLQEQGDIVMSLGWSSMCMGMKRGYRIVEIILCAHGAGHNDTICTVEVKEKRTQLKMF